MRYCPNHHGITADKVCSVCGQTYCADCMTVVNDKNYCPRAYCRQKIVDSVKGRIENPVLSGSYGTDRGKKFIKRSAAALIIFAVINILVSFSGCNRIEMNPDDIKMAADIMGKMNELDPAKGNEFKSYFNKMNEIAGSINDFSKMGESLSILMLFAGFALISKKKIGRYISSVILFVSVLFTAYYSYLNYHMMKEIAAFTASSEMLSQISAGFNLVTILAAVFSVSTVIYFFYLLIRINMRPVKDCFD